MKSSITIEVLLLVLSTCLLISTIHHVTSLPVDDGTNPDLKPPCPAEGNGEAVLVNFGDNCEDTANSCYKNCSTNGAVCLKQSMEVQHHHHSGGSEDEASNGADMTVAVLCMCPKGNEPDADKSHCVEKQEKPSESGSVAAKAVQDQDGESSKKPDTDTGTEDKDKDAGNSAMDKPETHEHDHGDGDSGKPNGSTVASVEQAANPDEAPKSKSNIGLAVGVITLCMFGMIFVFLVRHKINNLFRRMCGGSQPVPQHEN